MASFLYSTTANSDINTKNDNSWKTMSDIVSNTIKSIPDGNDAAPITAVEVSFVIHSDWNGYFSTDTRLVIKGASTTAQHYNTGKFSGNRRRTYKFLINDNDFTIGYLKNNPTQLKLQFKAYRASGQGTLKVYCKSQTVKITYYTGVIPISFESPANEEQFKQYTDEINIRLSKKSNDTNTYTLKIKNTETSEEIYSEGMVFNNDIYNKSIGPYNTLQTLTLQCLNNNNNNETVAECQIEIIKNDIFAISPAIKRYNLITGENLYESAFDGEYVVVAVDVTVLAESFLDKNITFTFSAVDDTTDENNPKSVSVEIEKIQKVFSISNLFKKEETIIGSYFKFSSDKNYTVSLIATDNNNNSIFEQNILISPATPILNVDEGGVAVGQFSTGTSESPKFECAYPAIFKYFDDEKECGIWIDGSIIYRKIITFGAVPFNYMKKKPMGINFDDIKDLISFHGGCLRGSGVWTTLDCSAISVTSNISIWIKKYNYEEDYPHLFDQTILPEENEALVCIGTGNVATGSIQRGILIVEYTKNVNVETGTEPET